MINIPNTLSVLRILMIPVFCYIFLKGQRTGDYVTAAAILAVSGITDIVDGVIARKFNMITKLGKVLDPIADKLTLFAVCTCLWIKFPGLWFIFLFFILKEVIIMLGSVLLIKKSVTLDGAKWFGKLYTVVFYVVTVIIILFDKMPPALCFFLLCFMGCFSVLSLGMYIPIFLKLNNPQKYDKA